MNAVSSGLRIWAKLSFVLSQLTRLTDGQTAKTAMHKMQRGKTEH